MRYAAAVTYVASVAFGFGAAVTGCQSGPPDGTAVGIFVRAGGPVPGPPVPLAGKVTAAPAGGGSAVTVSVGKDGRFRISLPSGSYRFTATTWSLKMTCSAAHAVTIRSGRTTAGIKIVCSIR